MTSYETIYTRFLNKIEDYKILSLSDEDVRELLHGYLEAAIANCRQCKSDLSDVDEETMTGYVTNEDGTTTVIKGAFNADLEKNEIEILALLMVAEWLEPQVNSTLLTKQMIGGKDAKFFSQSAHLKELVELQDRSIRKANALMNRYRLVNNKYLDKEG